MRHGVRYAAAGDVTEQSRVSVRRVCTHAIGSDPDVVRAALHFLLLCPVVITQCSLNDAALVSLTRVWRGVLIVAWCGVVGEGLETPW